jgi:hypothetical protein
MADQPTNQKDQYLRVLSDAEREARDLVQTGHDLVRAGQLAADMAALHREVVSQVPDDRLLPDVCHRQIDSWSSWRDGAIKFKHYTNVGSLVALSQAVANTCSSEFIVSASPPLPESIEVVVENGKLQLHRILERTPLLDEARALMQRFGLDTRGGSFRPPLDLLNEAGGALERPVVHDGRPTSVLITLRECIEATLSELVRRRPLQEPGAKVGGKVTSIGRQCARADLPSGHFERLGTDGDILVNDLSSTKQAVLPRDKVIALFNRGLLFLNTLMNSLDESRLKPA